jgi:hypothetical protein
VRRAALAVVVVALLAGACAEPAIPRAEAQGLQTVVARIRAAAEAGKTSAARVRLARLTEQVEELVNADVIAQDTAMEILDAAAAVRAALALAPPTSSAPPTESSTPTPSPEEETDEDHGNKGGKGKGHGDEGHGNDD